MITLVVFCILWGLCGGSSDTVKNLTDAQMLFVFLICVASDLNIVAGRLK